MDVGGQFHWVQLLVVTLDVILLEVNKMNNEQLKSDLLKNEADEFWANCESKAAELEITVDYYLEEFYI